ncbi:MAG: ATPase, T2SS/T4P/T4SS family [Acidobacteriota bacterium]
MSLVPSLLQAIVSVDGEVLVMHATEKPYVVSPSGQVELARGALTLEGVSGIVTELLPPDIQRMLNEVGAVQYDLPPQPEFPREQFTVIAARGDDDVWAEIRRRRIPDDGRGPEAFWPLPTPPVFEDATEPTPGQHRVGGAKVAIDTAVDEAARSGEPPAAARPWPPSSPGSVVVPMPRGQARDDDPPFPADSSRPVERLLRAAAACGATMLCLRAGAQPSMRVGGALQLLDDERPIAADVVQAALDALRPGTPTGAPGAASADEWTSDVPGVGRICCTTFCDQAGPGVVLRLLPDAHLLEGRLYANEARALVAHPDGLVLLAGAPATNGRGLMAALVDEINGARAVHVITIEQRIDVVHPVRRALVSQRQIHGGAEATLAAVRAALREEPDVLAIEAIRSGEVMELALDAAADGCLVLAGIAAKTAADTVARAAGLSGPSHARRLRGLLAECLRGVIVHGAASTNPDGRFEVREVVVATRPVAEAIARGRAFAHLQPSGPLVSPTET